MSPGTTPAVTAPGNLFLFDNHFSDEIFPNIQCEPPLAQFEGFFPLFHHFLLEEQSQELNLAPAPQQGSLYLQGRGGAGVRLAPWSWHRGIHGSPAGMVGRHI